MRPTRPAGPICGPPRGRRAGGEQCGGAHCRQCRGARRQFLRRRRPKQGASRGPAPCRASANPAARRAVNVRSGPGQRGTPQPGGGPGLPGPTGSGSGVGPCPFALARPRRLAAVRSSIVATLDGESLCITPFGLHPSPAGGALRVRLGEIQAVCARSGSAGWVGRLARGWRPGLAGGIREVFLLPARASSPAGRPTTLP